MTQAAAEPRWQVVVVGDNPGDRADVRRMLSEGSQRRYDFIDAATGMAGVQVVLGAPAGSLQCVILDYHLPDCAAPDMLAALSHPDGGSVCPAVVVVGSDSRALGRNALQAGAQDYIGRAWMTAESLVRTVEHAVERWAMSCALRTSEVRLRILASTLPRRARANDVTGTTVHDDELKLKESDARLRLALEATRTGIWTWDVGSDVVTWSPECHAIHGIPPGEFGGTGAAFFRLVHPDDRAHVEATVGAAIADHNLYHLDFRVVRPDGEVVWVQNLGRASYDAAGAPVRLLGTITDISPRKRTEEALRARERELQMIADHTPDIIARFDRRLRHVFINAAVEKATGVRQADFLGKTNRELGMPEHICERWDAALRSVFADRQPVALDFDFPTPDETRHYSNRMVPEIDQDGEVAFVLVVTHDMTERKRAEDALRAALLQAEQAVRARDQLVSLVSHDLKNPLNMLGMGVQFLERKFPTEDRGMLQRMRRQIQRMDTMLEDLLDGAQLGAGKTLDLELQSIDLVHLVRKTVDEYGDITARHHFEVHVAEEPLIGTWDARRLARVVNNLLSNAIKYSPNGGAVRVDLAGVDDAAGAWAVLRVSDEGIGVAEADRARVFEWYSRGENARRMTIHGSGVGLAGARDIVEQHRGSISVESEEGKGSVFTVRLPLSTPRLPRPAEAARSLAQDLPSK